MQGMPASLCYPSAMQVWINGHAREFPDLTSEPTVKALIAALAMQADRVAVEKNGAIVPRSEWPTAAVGDGDRFEIVHFVGGGRC